MHSILLLTLPVLLIGGRSAAVAETVNVTFVHPETYTDASLYGGVGTKAGKPVLKELSQYLEMLGTRYLASGQSATVEIMDIDLAGQFEPWRKFAYDVRIMRDVYPPRITIRYRLMDSGRIVTEGQETLVNVDYLANPAVRLSEDPLRYEKALLADWFQKRFTARTTGPA
jgi:hypothetical protein